MNWRKAVAAMFCAVVANAASTGEARAAEPAKQTPFSTNGPIEVPGMMVETGRYIFKLIEPEPERNVLQVFETVQLWTGDGTRLLSTMLTMPNYDLPATDKTVFSFFERGPKQPKALRLWFAPGRNYGQEFVYPKAQAVELAKSVGRAVLSMPPELPGDIGRLASMVVEPNPTPVKVPLAASMSEPRPAIPTEVAPTPSSVPPNVEPPPKWNPPPVPSTPPKPSLQPVKTLGQDAASDAAPVNSRLRTPQPPMQMMASSLPKTASYLALLAFVGMLSIAGGAVLRILALRLERR
jgi:hypothetical protein